MTTQHPGQMTNPELAKALQSATGAERAALAEEATRRFVTFAGQENAIHTAIAFMMVSASEDGAGMQLEAAQEQVARVMSEGWMPSA